jgi:hypothetical protein
MSMMKMAKFLGINRSVDGMRRPSRLLKLPGKFERPALSVLLKGPASGEWAGPVGGSTPRCRPRAAHRC